MRIITIFMMALFVLIISSLFLISSELGNQNLNGIQFVVIAAEFNGILFEEGYVDQNEEVIKPFNLEKAASKLKKDGIPITKQNIREIYYQVETMIQKTDFRVLKAKKYSKENTTIIPTLTVDIDIMVAARNLYFTVIHLTLSKWLSNWSGTKRIYAPVYIWSEKKMMAIGSNGLMRTILRGVSELMQEFIGELKKANMHEEKEKTRK